MSAPDTKPLDKIIQQHGDAYWRLWDRRLLKILIAVLFLSFIARIDRVITAPGKIVPYDKVKIIQHLEGGIVKKLLVRENQEVKMGEPLVELDLATAGVNGAEMSVRMANFKLTQVRLQAEANGKEPQWPAEMMKKHPDVAQAEIQTFLARRNEHQSTLAAIDGQIIQNRQRIAELKARFASLEANLKIGQQELAMSDSLLKDKLVSQLDHFQRKSNVERLLGDIEMTRQSIPGAQGALEEAVARRKEEESKFRRRASDERSELERKVASLKEELNRADDQEKRAIIRAPIDGVVKNVRYQSAGNVVKPGEGIMEVVPLKEQLVVEVKLNPSDRGFVIVGQTSLVKISAFDFYRYGGLNGRVTGIAADTDLGKNEEQFYRVVIATDKAFLGSNKDLMQITPGMTAEVDIKIDTQSVFWALLRPILKIKHEAFREI